MTPVIVRIFFQAHSQVMVWMVPSLPLLDNALDQIQWTPTFEFRTRYEARQDRDFNGSAEDRRSDIVTRFRPGIKAKLGKWSAALEYQYAHDRIYTRKRDTNEDYSDASLAYLRYEDGAGTLTLGRQKIALGSERLLGPLEWNNVARSFDGIRFQTKTLDLFAFKIGVAQVVPGDARFAGISYKSNLGATSLLYKSDEIGGKDAEFTTLAHHYQGSLAGLALDFEGALQTGEAADGRDQEAWAFHLGLGKALNAKWKVGVEFNAGSGGGDSDTSKTFDNYLPTNHKFYGPMDLFAWKNMTELAASIAYKPTAASELKLSFRDFGLYDAKDAWYGAGGGVNRGSGGAFRDPSGAAGKDVGSEIDFEASWSLNKNSQIHAAYSVFSPGKFVDRLTVGKPDKQSWFFLSWSYKF